MVDRLEEAPRRVREGEVAVDLGGETRGKLGRSEGVGCLMWVCFGVEGKLEELLVSVLDQGLGEALGRPVRCKILDRLLATFLYYLVSDIKPLTDVMN